MTGSQNISGARFTFSELKIMRTPALMSPFTSRSNLPPSSQFMPLLNVKPTGFAIHTTTNAKTLIFIGSNESIVQGELCSHHVTCWILFVTAESYVSRHLNHSKCWFYRRLHVRRPRSHPNCGFSTLGTAIM